MAANTAAATEDSRSTEKSTVGTVKQPAPASDSDATIRVDKTTIVHAEEE